ncbi:VOC family protein [Subtercola sp. RTI3]|uniref:VOC family protein n=1 Tax=Subtercola sp. RTI3 TaxID=3048639 RepID=UPI002B23A599|nr:VOC family protein [Subtercola sp. RTI3]MEA9984181.1 VOC family protein [Subtercola sp. RTI3]
MTSQVFQPRGFSHIRLTVTDIGRSKAFYESLFGTPPGNDFSDQIDDPSIHDDPARLYGGCSFTFAGQIMGLRPVAPKDDRFNPNRVGLDHLSFAVATVAELHAAAERLTAAGVVHGEVTPLPDFNLVIVSLQDPDDINLELAAPLGS